MSGESGLTTVGPSQPDVLPSTARLLLAVTAQAQSLGRLPSLAAGLVREGHLCWTAHRGDPAVDAHPTDVQYRIGSITKTFTAVLVMRLRDEGRLDLDTPVGQLVPDAPAGDRTVGQLLGHASGLRAETSGQWWERTAGRDWAQLTGPLAADAVRHPAGRRFHYSNLGYAVLGRIVESLRGSSWEQCLRTEILQPLGMARTTAHATAPAAAGTAVHPWAPITLPEPAPDYRAMAPAGQLWSTVGDLARWVRFLLGESEGVLDPGTVAEMAVPGLSDTEGGEYGLGLQIRTHEGHTLAGHGGSVPGFLAGLLVDPGEKTGVVVLANATSGLSGDLGAGLLSILRRAEPWIVPAWQPLPAAATVPLDLLGPWYWGPYPLLLVLNDDGLLELRGLTDGSRESRFRDRQDGAWLGLDGYWAGELLRVVRDGEDPTWLELGSFALTREPYQSGPTPGGVGEGWPR